MANLSEIRDGLKANLETVTGFRAHDVVPGAGQLNPPAGVVTVNRITFNDTFDGTNEYQFVVQVFVSRADQRTAQNTVDTYLSSGAESLKAAIESDHTLGGKAFSTVVTEMTDYGTLDQEGGSSYVVMSLTVLVGA